MPSGFVHHIIWTVPFPVQSMSGLLLLLLLLINISVFNTNRVDPDLGQRFCQCPLYGTLRINELIFRNQSNVYNAIS